MYILWVWSKVWWYMGFSDGSVVKNPPANAGDSGSIPGSGRSLGGGHGTPFQYSCPENFMVIGAWQVTIHGVSVSQTRLSDRAHTWWYIHVIIVSCRELSLPSKSSLLSLFIFLTPPLETTDLSIVSIAFLHSLLQNVVLLESYSMPIQFSSVTQSCPTLCNSMDRSTPGFPVHHQLPELA